MISTFSSLPFHVSFASVFVSGLDSAFFSVFASGFVAETSLFSGFGLIFSVFLSLFSLASVFVFLRVDSNSFFSFSSKAILLFSSSFSLLKDSLSCLNVWLFFSCSAFLLSRQLSLSFFLSFIRASFSFVRFSFSLFNFSSSDFIFSASFSFNSLIFFSWSFKSFSLLLNWDLSISISVFGLKSPANRFLGDIFF